jgi:hypothetical protein
MRRVHLWRCWNFLTHRLPDYPRRFLLWAGWKSGSLIFLGKLYVQVTRANGSVEQYGLVSTRKITTTFATDLVDNLRNAVSTINSYKFHGIGTGSNAEAAGDTGLQTELAGGAYTAGVRATGSQTNNGATVYHTVGQNQVVGAQTITEAGLFNNATVGAGILMDRFVFAGIALSAGDTLQTTIDITVSTGT